MIGGCFPSHVTPKAGMYVHCDCWHCTLQRLLANTSSRCPRVLRLRYLQEHRTPLGMVCVLLFLFASHSSSGHDSGHEMSARVCGRQSEMLSLCENAWVPHFCTTGGSNMGTSLIRRRTPLGCFDIGPALKAPRWSHGPKFEQ